MTLFTRIARACLEGWGGLSKALTPFRQTGDGGTQVIRPMTTVEAGRLGRQAQLQTQAEKRADFHARLRAELQPHPKAT